MNNGDTSAWVVSVSMGLGHLRAVYPLREIAYQGVQLIGDASTSSPAELKLWNNLRKSYEFLSRVKKVPIIGNFLFGILDNLQSIPPLYPLRDLSKPGYQTSIIYSYLNKGIGKALMDKIATKSLPVICSYPIAAVMVDYYNYPRNYCIICDAEISRAWVAKDARKSRIHYFAPSGRSVQRLRQYGVPDERIFLTGFPLPKEILGTENLEILKGDLGQRLHYLDPERRFWPLHQVNVEYFIGKENTEFKNERKLSITYAVGGAGALAEVGIKIAKSLKKYILNGEIKLNLVAALRKEVNDYFKKELAELGIPENLVYVLHSPDPNEYFAKFAQLMRVTDVLWTKPSELSFYAGLGLPVVMCDPLGTQEIYNKKWLLEIQAGIPMENPEYCDQWLLDLWKYGRLAECAWDGFLKARKFGTYKIEEVIRTGTMQRESNPLRR